MGTLHKSIQPAFQEFIKNQCMFFVGTAPLSENGHINISPKGNLSETFRIISENQVAYLDLISSGNETSAHTLENGRITFMFCAFEGPPMILRLYGKGRTILPGSNDWEQYSKLFQVTPNTRQVIVADIDLVQTSCGFTVPHYEHTGERTKYQEWADTKGDNLFSYIDRHNLESIDGLPTDWGVQKLK